MGGCCYSASSSNDLYTQFDYTDPAEKIVIDFTDAHLWDASTIAALDSITHKYERHGKTVEVVGLNANSAARRDRLAGHLGAGH